MSVSPSAPLAFTVLATTGTDDYRLLDSGFGAKLERFGDVTLVRPEEQAVWTPRLPQSAWAAADARFTGDTDVDGAGRWRLRDGMTEAWNCRHGPIAIECRLTSFRHVGLFPEQAAHFAYLEEEIGRRGPGASILNLFGYTGVASLVAAAAGARVTHVDASRKAIDWARRNQSLSGLDGAAIRWIPEDAMRFVEREARRGVRHDGIILDPPKYGRGPKGETWHLFEHLPAMLRLCRDILAPGGFVILTAYAIRASALFLGTVGEEAFGTRLECGELVLEEATGRRLSTSLFARGRVP